MLRDRRFVQFWAAGVASDLGDALHYIALMWFAFELGGPLGLMAVRLADSVPALVFGLYGGVLADRFPRRALLIGADIVRGLVLLPLAYVALTGQMGIAQLVVSAFLLETAASLFQPAHGAILPALVGYGSIQRANAFIRTSHHAMSIGGWAAAAGMLAVMPMGMFFALNALSFFVSALCLIGMPRVPQHAPATRPRIAEGLAPVRARPLLAIAIGALGVAGTVGSGSWIAGLPQLVKVGLGQGASAFSLTMVAYAIGALGTGLMLGRFVVVNKARASLWCWAIELPGFVLFAMASELWHAMLGAALVGVATSSGKLLLMSAAQSDSPPETLGRVMGLVSLVDRGSRAVGLLLVAPLYSVFPVRPLLALTGVVQLAVAVGCLLLSRRRWHADSPKAVAVTSK